MSAMKRYTAAAFAAITLGGAAHAHELEKVSVAFERAIPNIAGKSLVALVVTYPPGGTSPSHRHAQSAFIYAHVLTGAIRSQVDDEPARVYRVGEGFHEVPEGRQDDAEEGIPILQNVPPEATSVYPLAQELLPLDRPRPEVATERGAHYRLDLGPVLSEKLKAFAHERGTTLFAVLLASLNVLFHRYSGQRDIRVGTPVANRQRPETEHLIGYLMNTLVLRTQLAPEALLPALKELELRIGRAPTHRMGPRVIDLDILFYDDVQLDSPDLRIPHPGVMDRAFVIAPLLSISAANSTL